MGKINMNKKILILLVALFIGTQVGAESVTVPNTFVDGTTASASEVNANFSALETGINNIRSINVFVNGVRRGAFLDSYLNSFVTATAIRVLLDSRYIALVSTAGDGVFSVIKLGYESANCTGQAYIDMTGWNPMMAQQGLVFSNGTPAPGTLYSVYARTAVETITIESTSKDGVCDPAVSLPGVSVAKVSLNDSTLTGVTKSDFIGDVTLGF